MLILPRTAVPIELPYCLPPQGIFGTPNAVILDQVALALRTGAQGLAATYPQVHILDMYTLFAVRRGSNFCDTAAGA